MLIALRCPHEASGSEKRSLAAALTHEPLPIPECFEVGGVDSDVTTVLGQRGADRSREAIEAPVEHRLETAELFAEAIQRVNAGRASESVLQGGVLSNESSRPAPCRDRVERLHETRADEGARAVTLAARLPGILKLLDHPRDLGRVEQFGDESGVGAARYTLTGQGGHSPWSRPPEVRASRGSIFRELAGNFSSRIGRHSRQDGLSSEHLFTVSPRRAGDARPPRPDGPDDFRIASRSPREGGDGAEGARTPIPRLTAGCSGRLSYGAKGGSGRVSGRSAVPAPLTNGPQGGRRTFAVEVIHRGGV